MYLGPRKIVKKIVHPIYSRVKTENKDIDGNEISEKLWRQNFFRGERGFSFHFTVKSKLLDNSNYYSVKYLSLGLSGCLPTKKTVCVALFRATTKTEKKKSLTRSFVLHTCNSKGESLSMFSHAFDFFRRM